MPQPKLFSIIDKAVYDYHMIEKGDRRAKEKMFAALRNINKEYLP